MTGNSESTTDRYGYPLAAGTKIDVNDTKSHKEHAVMRHAIDFLCDIGTQVVSARAGIVILIKEDSTTCIETDEQYIKALEEEFGREVTDEIYDAQGEGIQQAMQAVFIKYTNRVLIQHDDGTIAEYVHLGANTVTKGLKEGDQVGKDEPLAKTGKSGIMTKPHLHFNIVEEIDGQQVSKPIIWEQEAVAKKINEILG